MGVGSGGGPHINSCLSSLISLCSRKPYCSKVSTLLSIQHCVTFLASVKKKTQENFKGIVAYFAHYFKGFNPSGWGGQSKSCHCVQKAENRGHKRKLR